MVWQRSFRSDRLLPPFLPCGNLVDDFDAARGTDPARRAFAAGFDGAELHRKARLRGHVDAVVKDDDAAVADQPVARRERLVIERRVEQCARKIGARAARRPAPPHRAARCPCRRRCRRPVRPSVMPNAGLEQAAVLDVAGQLNRHACRATCPCRSRDRTPRRRSRMIGTVAKLSTLLMTVGLPNRPLMRRQRRLGAHDAALAFQAFQQRGLLAADIGARPARTSISNGVRRTCNARAQHAVAARAPRCASFIVAIACGYSERI